MRGGKGTYVVFARNYDNDNKSHQMYSIAQGNEHAYNCEASSYDVPITAEIVAACKSLTPTD